MITENWYLLFDGESVDGYGHPKYVGRTTEYSEVISFFKKHEKNPYWIGHVIKVTDESQIMMGGV